LQNTVALFLAVLLHTKLRLFQTYRAAIFLPGILSLVASGLMWQIILGPNIGMLTPLMQGLGLGSLTRDKAAECTQSTLPIAPRGFESAHLIRINDLFVRHLK